MEKKGAHARINTLGFRGALSVLYFHTGVLQKLLSSSTLPGLEKEFSIKPRMSDVVLIDPK